jgi:hypothetical protein
MNTAMRPLIAAFQPIDQAQVGRLTGLRGAGVSR